ncbi:MAG: hypothetical protein Fur003_3460 [Candidatus Dojkabacteria bacterium]
MLNIMKRKESKSMTLGEVTELLNWIRTPTALVFTPVNLLSEKAKFLDSESYNPNFKYRIVRNSNYRILDELEAVTEITDVDPRISEFYLELIKSKVEANELMHAVGDNERFTDLSISRFKLPSYKLFKNAARVLRGRVAGYNVIPNDKADKGADLAYDQIEAAFMAVFSEYGLGQWLVAPSQNILSDGIKVGTKKKEVLMDPNIHRQANRLRKTIVHETTHIIRSYNGSMSGLDAFSKANLSEYLDIEEGLTSYMENQMGLMSERDIKGMAAYAWAVYMGPEMTFRELYNSMLAFTTPNLAWKYTFRVKRGLGDTSKPGIYSRDAAYFRGFRKVRRLLKEDSSLFEKLFAGKISMKQIRWVEEGLLPKAKVIPSKEVFEKAFEKAGI